MVHVKLREHTALSDQFHARAPCASGIVGGMLTGTVAWVLDAQAVGPNVDLPTDVMGGPWEIGMLGSATRPEELVDRWPYGCGW